MGKYHSIVFPSPAGEKQAAVCPWLVFRSRRVQSGHAVRGNKIYPTVDSYSTEAEKIPTFFTDTCLDQLLDETIPAKCGARLRSLFYALSTDRETVLYRQAIVRALERSDIATLFRTFCREIESALQTTADGRKVHGSAQREKYIVDGAVAYCDAVRGLLANVSGAEIPSCGLRLFVDAVREYAESTLFRHTETVVRQAKAGMEKIAFRLRIQKGKVIVTDDPVETDFTRATREDFTFAGFETAATEDAAHEIRLFGGLELCPLGARIADALQTLHPEAFAALSLAAEAAKDVLDPTVQAFTEEVPFYFRSLETLEKLKAKGLAVSLPSLSQDDTITLRGAYDCALALKRESIVPNDLSLRADERGVVITGANHSGKTTFLRAFGQIAVLTALGLPVPCAQASLPLCHGFYSHFSEPENGDTDRGRLMDELLGLRPILTGAGKDSLVLLNEMFSSTTAWDAQAMTEKALKSLADGGARILCVTHTVCEIPERFVSLTSRVDPDSRERLYQIVRAPAASHAYAEELASKYRLTYETIKERILHGV